MNAEAEFIRQAIAREQYQTALVQWNAYIRQLERAIEAGSLSAEQMAEVRALVEGSRAALLSARAQLRAHYHELEVAAAYNGHPAARPGSLRTLL